MELGERTLIAGILNLTPDSFSDGGLHPGPEEALCHARRMIEEGADLIDLGGESTRPGAEAVSPEEEQCRVIPVLRRLRAETDLPLSIDTRHAATAEAALACGADIVNDVSALGDPRMADTVRRAGAGLVLMHMRGHPATMQENPVYRDVVGEVGAFLRGRIRAALEAGLAEDSLAVDPGIGFGKTLAHNLALLRNLPRIDTGGRPWWIGLSRKRLLGEMTGRPAGERLAASLAALTLAADRGAHILRVHDVKESCDAARVVDDLWGTEARDPRVTGHSSSSGPQRRRADHGMDEGHTSPGYAGRS